MTKTTERKRGLGFFGRLLRSLVSIIILTALVLGISYTVKQLSILDTQKLVSLSSPLLNKLGLDEEQVGEVAGVLAEKVSQVQIEDTSDSAESSETSSLSFSVAIMSDAEDDTESLTRALELAKEKDVSAVFYLGDFTSWGDKPSIMKMKDILDQSGVQYYAIPGDHDLAASVQEGDTTGLTNFREVFGEDFHVVLIEGYKFLLMNNAANYTTVSKSNMLRFSSEAPTASFVLLSQPLYHPTIKIYMGMVSGKEVADVKAQGQELLDTVRQSGIQAIFAGDQHNFSKNSDPDKPELEHIVTGALVSNDQELRNPQKSRFTLLEIYEDETYKIKEVVL